MERRALPVWFYKFLIVIATVMWGFSFVVTKDAVNAMGPAWLMGLRFIGTSLILIVAFRKTLAKHLNRGNLLAGIALGAMSFLGFWLQTVGITDTTPGKNAFLTTTYCVMVPFVYWAATRRKPTLCNIVAAFMCIAGVALVALKGGGLTMQWGDAMTLLSAFFFAVHIVMVAMLARNHEIMTITIVQIAASGVFGVGVGLVAEPLPVLETFTPAFLMQLGYLIVFASCLAMVFQNVGQAHVPPAQAALLLALESVFGVIFSVMFYGEQVTAQLLLGFALIFGAIVVSETGPGAKGGDAGAEPDGAPGAETDPSANAR